MVNADLVKDWEVNYDAIIIDPNHFQEAIDDWSSYLEEQATKKAALAQTGLSGAKYAELCRLIDSGEPFDAAISLT